MNVSSVSDFYKYLGNIEHAHDTILQLTRKDKVCNFLTTSYIIGKCFLLNTI